jgi:hypothetical protein
MGSRNLDVFLTNVSVKDMHRERPRHNISGPHGSLVEGQLSAGDD